jgi:adenosylcobyric acid synthase
VRGVAVLGTGSDVGKSFVATALCRVLRNRGYDVAPYKAQNMSNNAGITRDGWEIARAQIVQAEAARVDAIPDMNPVLLKPTSERGAQVILNGRAIGAHSASEYFRDTTRFRAAAMEALGRLRERYPVIVAEGAGSCAEVNLRTRDFTNFDVAHAADLGVLLVADIDRGGVFGQIVGTLDVLDDRDRARVKGILVNRFRGDPELFRDGVAWLEARTGLPIVGVLPWSREVRIESEDALPPDALVDPPPPLFRDPERVRVAVVVTPHIANFTDFLPLTLHPEIELHWLTRPRDLGAYDLVILAGSRNTRRDLDHLWASGWADAIRRRHDRGGHLGGVCGGYQMLGREVADPLGVEAEPGATPGLDLLAVRTEFAPEKRLGRSAGRWLPGDAPIRGYEIHHGRTERLDGPAAVRIALRPEGDVDEADGALSADGRVWGTYLHGLFDEPRALAAILTPIRPDLDFSALADRPAFEPTQEAAYDRLARHFSAHVDVDGLLTRL